MDYKKEIMKQLEAIEDDWLLSQILKFIINMKG